jgi:hypothetical protein
MKFNIGDRVRFLNDVGGGKVVKYVDEGTVVVLNDDDFEIPVPINELIPESANSYNKPAGERFLTSNQPDTRLKKADIIEKVEKNDHSSAFFLAFVPVDQKMPTDSSLKLYLVNDSNYSAFANVLVQYGSMYVSYPKTVESNTKIEIKLFAKNDLNDIDSITVQSVFYKKEPHKLLPAVSHETKINPIKFFKENIYVENDFFDELAYLITVYDENMSNKEFPEINVNDLKKAFLEKEFQNTVVNKKPVSKTSKSTESWEIDLHIHELLDDFSSMSPKEMIDYQLDCFRKEMQNAINERVKKVIFIHGKGNGVLKAEIRKELKTNYRKYQFQDASFQQYGFGATAVYIS